MWVQLYDNNVRTYVILVIMQTKSKTNILGSATNQQMRYLNNKTNNWVTDSV